MEDGYKFGAMIFAILLFIILFGGIGIAYLVNYLKTKKNDKKNQKTRE